ncbi:threonine/serine exporter family protein [Arthrobacter crusticola]|uniref:Threonine/serine exporter family protein n=1 Tax=Arthrobacter crusticola TaxID=2547960 RepID=A0A4R5TYU1_9MICC|nr:threonine/serine exporter family protein [Arthrobacter crusticola]TDK26419.1 threonine/serine exporter family protein [Arthrobacter crusticola]
MDDKAGSNGGRKPETNPSPAAGPLPVIQRPLRPPSTESPSVARKPGGDPSPPAQGAQRAASTRQPPAPGPAQLSTPGAKPRPRPARRPSRAPSPTDALPTTPRTVRPDRSNAAARNVLRRLVQGEEPPTQAMSIVERLAGSPYANPTIQVGGPDASARKTLDFALSLAETMFRYGAGALEVETSIIAVTAALGLDHIEVDITNQSVVINYSAKDQTPTTVLRVVRSWTNNYAGLTAIHQLVSDIAAGGVSRIEAAQRLEQITRRPKPFPRWMVTAAFGIFGAAIVAFIGGGVFGALIGLGSCILVDLVSRQLGRWRVPEFFSVATSSAMATLIAMLFWWLEVPIAPSLVVVGGILLLLPAGRLVSATQDAINGFPVTAAGRFLSALLIFGGVVSGIAVALVFGAAIGIPDLELLAAPASPYPWPVIAVLIFIAVAMFAVTEQTDLSLVVPTALVGTAGYVLWISAINAGVGYRLAPALAAVLIGALSRIVALRMGAPQLVLAVPAVMFLYPGLAIFRAMYMLTTNTGIPSAGALGLFNAFTVILAVAGGVVLGDNLARPLTRGLGSNERRRNRRR